MALRTLFVKSSKLGLNSIDGNNAVSLFNKSNMFSGNPVGKVKPGNGTDRGLKGIPNPGIGIPGINAGFRLLSFGEHGTIYLSLFSKFAFE